MDKITGEARFALTSKKDLTNDLLEKILSWIPRDKDCKSQVADLIHGSHKFFKIARGYILQDTIHAILQQAKEEEATYSGSDEEFMMLNNYEEHNEFDGYDGFDE